MKKRIVTTSLISIILISILFISNTYSIFTSEEIDENRNVYQTGNLNVSYILSADNVNFTDVIPKTREEVEFIKPYRITVTNSGTVDYKFDVVLTDTTQTNKIDLNYIMVQVGKIEPITLASTTGNVIKKDIVVPAKSSVPIDVRVYIKDDIDSNSIDKNFSAKLSINGIAVSSEKTTVNNEELIANYLTESIIYDFDYTGKEAEFVAKYSGTYRLEAWGAQGGKGLVDNIQTDGGYGGYSVGDLELKRGDKLYINVGGKGEDGKLNVLNTPGGYNGGGIGHWDNNGEGANGEASGGGGGATHVAEETGLLSTLSSKKDKILIVAGGGGGGTGTTPGHGGGYKGVQGINTTGNNPVTVEPGTQTSGYAFGQGGPGATNKDTPGGGGGSGFYGGYGGSGDNITGAGGSGYIANPKLKNKKMQCVACIITNSDITAGNENTLTNNQMTKISEEAISDYTKKGNGYVRITYVPTEYNYLFSNSSQKFTAKYKGKYKLEVWGAAGGGTNEIRGFGSYSKGIINLDKGTELYITVGGLGGSNNSQTNIGGYNGGGASGNNADYNSFGGGGATHIATQSGLLSSLSNLADRDKIIIVAGGGGGGTTGSTTRGGSGGGKVGGSGSTSNTKYNISNYLAQGGTQSGPGFAYEESKRQGSLGQAIQTNTTGWGGGGGGGFYGGSNGIGGTGAGGSGYIGNSRLYEKYMLCYGKCLTSDDESEKTISSTTVSNIETNKNKSNSLNNWFGYARITYIQEKEYAFDYTGKETEFEVKDSGTYKLEVWGAQDGSTKDNIDGYGNYSVGKIILKSGDKLYINVGGTENLEDTLPNANEYAFRVTTYIATQSGLQIPQLNDIDRNKILISAGNSNSSDTNNNTTTSGLGYIGNSSLTNKHITCYNCQHTNDKNIRIIDNTKISFSPIADYVKLGNGYAKITYISERDD